MQSSNIKQAHGIVEVAAEALEREVELVLKRLAATPVVRSQQKETPRVTLSLDHTAEQYALCAKNS